jgi:molybdenum cofactor synthesis domain-containing protein
MSPESGTAAEIVAVGRELLSGHTVDTNSAWLAARLRELGARVTRIVSVDDDPAEIAREIAAARARGARLVITTGGLGPTADDCTLAGVAGALERPLREHAGAVAFVARRYAELAAAGAVADAALNAGRRKMACLPEGAEPIDNPVGTAPGVLIVETTLTLLSLPGVPREMQALFAASAARLRAAIEGPLQFVEREVASGSGDESVIAMAVARVAQAVPGVDLKSLPTTFAPDCDLRVRISARAPEAAEAEARVREAAERLEHELAKLTLGTVSRLRRE